MSAPHPPLPPQLVPLPSHRKKTSLFLLLCCLSLCLSLTVIYIVSTNEPSSEVSASQLVDPVPPLPPRSLASPTPAGQSFGGVLVPLYNMPTKGTEWDSVVTAQKTYPTLDFVGVLNPSNGPGTINLSPSVLWSLSKIKSEGGVIVGYVSTLYGQRDVSLIKTDIDKYADTSANGYMGGVAINGIFLDEAPTSSSYATQYATLYTYIKAKTWAVHVRKTFQNLVIINPGHPVNIAFYNTPSFDIVVSFEGPYNCGFTESCVQWQASSSKPAGTVYGDSSLPSWLRTLDPGRNAAMVHSCPLSSLTDATSLPPSRSVGWFFVTELVYPAPYVSIPSYITPAAGLISQFAINGLRAPAAVSNLKFSAISLYGMTANWTAPADTGGAPIKNYSVTLSRSSDSAVVTQLTLTATLYVFQSLQPGLSYTLSVAACNTVVTGYGTATLSTITLPSIHPPSAPLNLLTSSIAATSFVVTWQAPTDTGFSDLAGYRLRLFAGSDVSAPLFTQMSTPPSTLSYAVSPLTAGGTFTVAIDANNLALPTYGTAAIVTVTLLQRPSIPPSFLATSVSLTSITLSWLTPLSMGSSPIVSYTVECRLGGVLQASFTTPNPLTLSYTFSNLMMGTTYTFHVWAMTSMTANPGDAAVVTVTTLSPPSSPESLSVQALSDTSVALSWRTPTHTGGAAIASYKVLLLQGTAPPIGEVTVAGTVFTHVFGGLVSNATYKMTVSASNGALGTYGATATITTTTVSIPSAPASLTIVKTLQTMLSIAWTPPLNTGGSPIIGYRVSLISQGSATLSVLLVEATKRTLDLTLLSPNTVYTISIAARNSIVATYSVAISVTKSTTPVTLPSMPLAVVVSAATVAGFSVAWQRPLTDGGAPLTTYSLSISFGATTVHSTTTSVDILTYSVTGLQPNTVYTVAIAAKNSALSGYGDSATVTARTTIPTASGVATAPLSVTGSSIGATKATITWKQPAFTGNSTIIAYRVSRRSSSSDAWSSMEVLSSSAIQTTTVTNTVIFSTIISKLTPSTTYYFSVAAQNIAGWSDPGVSPTITTTTALSNSLFTITLAVDASQFLSTPATAATVATSAISQLATLTGKSTSEFTHVGWAAGSVVGSFTVQDDDAVFTVNQLVTNFLGGNFNTIGGYPVMLITGGNASILASPPSIAGMHPSTAYLVFALSGAIVVVLVGVGSVMIWRRRQVMSLPSTLPITPKFHESRKVLDRVYPASVKAMARARPVRPPRRGGDVVEIDISDDEDKPSIEHVARVKPVVGNGMVTPSRGKHLAKKRPSVVQAAMSQRKLAMMAMNPLPPPSVVGSTVLSPKSVMRKRPSVVGEEGPKRFAALPTLSPSSLTHELKSTEQSLPPQLTPAPQHFPTPAVNRMTFLSGKRRPSLDIAMVSEDESAVPPSPDGRKDSPRISFLPVSFIKQSPSPNTVLSHLPTPAPATTTIPSSSYLTSVSATPPDRFGLTPTEKIDTPAAAVTWISKVPSWIVDSTATPSPSPSNLSSKSESPQSPLWLEGATKALRQPPSSKVVDNGGNVFMKYGAIGRGTEPLSYDRAVEGRVWARRRGGTIDDKSGLMSETLPDNRPPSFMYGQIQKASSEEGGIESPRGMPRSRKQATDSPKDRSNEAPPNVNRAPVSVSPKDEMPNQKDVMETVTPRGLHGPLYRAAIGGGPAENLTPRGDSDFTPRGVITLSRKLSHIGGFLADTKN